MRLQHIGLFVHRISARFMARVVEQTCRCHTNAILSGPERNKPSRNSNTFQLRMERGSTREMTIYRSLCDAKRVHDILHVLQNVIHTISIFYLHSDLIVISYRRRNLSVAYFRASINLKYLRQYDIS